MNDYPAEALRPFEFLDRARQFHKAFLEVTPALDPLSDWPRYFLLCHAAELALKAYLAVHGASYDRLKDFFKHSLTKSLTEAQNKGLSLTASAREDIKALSEVH